MFLRQYDILQFYNFLSQVLNSVLACGYVDFSGNMISLSFIFFYVSFSVPRLIVVTRDFFVNMISLSSSICYISSLVPRLLVVALDMLRACVCCCCSAFAVCGRRVGGKHKDSITRES